VSTQAQTLDILHPIYHCQTCDLRWTTVAPGICPQPLAPRQGCPACTAEAQARLLLHVTQQGGG